MFDSWDATKPSGEGQRGCVWFMPCDSSHPSGRERAAIGVSCWPLWFDSQVTLQCGRQQGEGVSSWPSPRRQAVPAELLVPGSRGLVSEVTPVLCCLRGRSRCCQMEGRGWHIPIQHGCADCAVQTELLCNIH